MDRIERRAALQAARADELAAALDRLLQLRGDERALDVGAGLGALGLALAPRVREVVAVDRDEAMIERARATAPENVEFLVGDGEQLAFGAFEFDFAGTIRTLHHTRRPELLVAELVRVVKPGGTILVVDQLASVDPLAAFDLNRFERARDASTTRVLAEGDLRALFDANGLVLRREEIVPEPRDLDAYLELPVVKAPSASASRRWHRPSPRRRSAGSYLPDRSVRSRTTTPGARACPHANGRYQRGTKISRRSCSTASRMRAATSGGSATSRPPSRSELRRCSKPSVSIRPGLTVCTEMPLGASSTASERESASCACFDAEYGPPATVPATDDDRDQVRAATERREEREHRPERAEVVDADHLFDPLRIAVEELRARAEAGVAHEQVDRRVALEDARRDRIDSRAVGDVALLVLVGLRGAPREADDAPAVRPQAAHELGADPRARTRDDRYAQTLIARTAVAARPFVSRTVADRRWSPGFRLVVRQSFE